MKNIAIVGGGLVGSLLSIYLAKRGIDVTVYEKRPDIRFTGEAGGRSINLALSNRGWKALEEVGVAEIVKEKAIPMKGRMIHNLDGSVVSQAYGKEGEAIYSVSRGGLNQILDSFSIDLPNVDYCYESPCESVDIRNGLLKIKDIKTGETKEVSADLIIGTDGAYSKIRAGLQKRKRFNYQQDFLDHAYKELTIPAGPNNSWQIDKNALHIWPRESFMLIALPNLDGSFTCTLFLAFEGATSFANLNTNEEVIAFFKKEFPDALELMPGLTEDFFNNPTDALVTIRCYPWSYQSQFLLMGDASHAIVPFYGQGMNSGFEDARVFNEMIGKHWNEGEIDFEKLCADFEQSRKPDAEAIADLALKNFIEMRDSVADEIFLVRKKIEKFLQKQFPGEFTPAYSLVTFTEDMRYSEAYKRAKIQDELLGELMKKENVIQKWENGQLTNELTSLVANYQKLILQ